MYFDDYEIMREPEYDYSGEVLLRSRRDPSKGTVVYINRDAQQLQSSMPGDFPPGGGTCFAGISDAGVRYVSSLYSYAYARRKYNEMAAETAKERVWREDRDRLIVE